MNNPLGMSDEEILSFNYDNSKISPEIRNLIMNRRSEIRNRCEVESCQNQAEFYDFTHNKICKPCMKRKIEEEDIPGDEFECIDY